MALFSLGPCGRARLPFFHVGALLLGVQAISLLLRGTSILTRCVLSNEVVKPLPRGNEVRNEPLNLLDSARSIHSNVYWSFKRSDRSNEVVVQTSKRPPNRRSRYALDKARNSG